MAGSWVLGALILLPVIARPIIGVAVVGAGVAVWLASKSVAYPLALAGIPPLVDAIYGSDPLPKGGFTFLFAAWIGVAVLLGIARQSQVVPTRALASAVVALSFAFLVLMAFRLGPSLDQVYGTTKVELYIANNLVFLIGAVFVGSRGPDTRLFFNLVLALAAAGALLLAFELATGAASNLVQDRLSISAQVYPIQLGRSSADGLLLAIYTIIAVNRVGPRLWALAVFPALLVTLIAAGSRGPVVAFFFAVLTLVSLAAATGRARRRLLLVAGALLGAALLVPLVVPSSAIGRALSTIVGSSSGLSTDGRSTLWAQAIAAFVKQPLLGVGVGGFNAVHPGQFYPHNIILEAAVELGILGAVMMVGIIGGAFARLLRLWRTTEGSSRLDVALVTSLFLAALVNALFSGAFQDNRSVWLWAGLGLGMSARIRSRPMRAENRSAVTLS